MKKLVSILFVWLLLVSICHSQDSPERLLPKLLGASNTGKEFYLTFHPCWEIESDENFIKIYISSQFKTTVKLEIPELNVSRKLQTIPNSIIEFTLTPTEAQMYSKGDGVKPMPPQPENVWKGRAIKITADDPIICYGVTRFQYVSDGFLALPVHCWGKNYQVASYADYSDNKTMFLPGYTSIIAAYNNTEVTFQLAGDLNTSVPLESGDTLKAGHSMKRILNAGDVWLIPGVGQLSDLTGSQIIADKNICVISGNFCAQVPVGNKACDFLIEQEMPTDFWGKNYYVPTIINRIKASIIKIFAKEPNTSISFNNVPMLSIENLDGVSGSGFFETRTSLDNKPVLVSSTKNINVVLYNTSQAEDSVPGDPFQMNIVSEEQYQTEVMFNTPGVPNGLKFNDNYLNIIFKSKSNSIPDDLKFGFSEKDTLRWIKYTDYISNYKIESFKNDIPDKDGYVHYSATCKLPKDSIFRIKADKPFGVHGYGFTEYDCYGFPLSNGMKDQTINDTLSPEITVHDFGEGCYQGQITENGNSGFSFIEMINEISSNYKFERDEFTPGDSKVINYKLTKISSFKDAKAVIYISDRRGNDTTIVLEDFIAFKRLVPIITSDSSNFGYLKNGQKKQLVLKLKNSGNFNSKSVEDIVLEKGNSGFNIISPIKFPFILKANEVVDFKAEFTGGSNDGIFTDTIGVKTVDTTIYNFIIKATVSNPTIYVSDVDFGDYKIGNSALKNILTIANNGLTALEIDSIDFPKNNAFEIQVQKTSKENPLIIGNLGSLNLPVKFEPSVKGYYKDSVVFYSDGKILKNISYLFGNAVISSVEEFENKYGVINLSVKDNKISFSSGNDITLNSFSIYDLTGKIILTGNPAALLNNYNITISNISGSVYFIELNTQFGKVVKKIVVE